MATKSKLNNEPESKPTIHPTMRYRGGGLTKDEGGVESEGGVVHKVPARPGQEVALAERVDDLEVGAGARARWEVSRLENVAVDIYLIGD